MLNRKSFVVIALLCISQLAFAQAENTVDATSVLGFIKDSMAPAINKLTSTAISWLAALASLQFFITNYNLLKSDGDIQSVIAKGVASFVWVGVCFYLIQNGPQFIQSVGDSMFTLLGLQTPSPSSIISTTTIAAGGLTGVAVGVGPLSNTAGMLIGYLALFVLALGLFFAFKIFMLHLEIGLVAMLAPLSFAFLGMSSLKDQGIAPFKALLSLIYRIILLTVILSAFTEVSAVLAKTINSIGLSELANPGKVANAIISAIGAYVLLAYLVYKSDSIAATLASGSTSMGTGDVAQAAATGAALGAAVATGGATAATAGGKVPQSMSNFFGKMGGGGGSISNASPMGNGGGDTPKFTPPAPSMSAGGSPPAAPVAVDNTTPPARPQASGAQGTTGMPTKPKSVASGRYGSPSPGEQAHAPEAAAPAQNSPAPVGNSTSDPANQPGPEGAVPPQPAGTPADTAPGSGLPAAISGQNQTQPSDAPQYQGPRKPTLGERLGEANRHVSQEHTATSISINTHAD